LRENNTNNIKKRGKSLYGENVRNLNGDRRRLSGAMRRQFYYDFSTPNVHDQENLRKIVS